MALKQPNPRPQFLLKIALAFLVFFGFSTLPQIARASFLDDVLLLPSQLAKGAQIAATEVLPSFFNQASLTSVLNDIQCFFGFNCTETTINQEPITNNENQISRNQNPITEDQKPQQPESQTDIQPDQPKTPVQITQIINPTKEIQTIHTISNNTNTVVVDNDTKARLDQLLRQLNSDRPNYSTGQTVSLPTNLVSKTINITSGDFNVDENGNIIADDIISHGNLTVQGNFTVSGSQTYSGAASFSATSTTPALLVEQTGSGNALQADNVTIKDSMIATDNGGTLQFQTASNYLDANGNLVLAGDITAGKYNGLTINPTTKSLTVSNDATVSGTNTGDQTITLIGDITGSGTGSFATTIGNSKVTNAMLAGSIAANKLIGTDITTVGTITTGIWNGTTISPTKGGTGIANGTNNTITFTGNYTLGLTLSANTSLVLPASGTLTTTSDKLNAFASTNSAELAGTISDETGSGSLVFATSPTFTTQLTAPKVVGDTTGLYLNEDGGAGIFVKDGGNVGIGNTNPSSKLDVTGDIRISSGSGGQIIFADGSTMASSGLGSAAALSNTTDAIMTGDSDANNTGAVIFKTGSNDRLHILNNGNVGIGTASPDALLDLYKTGNNFLYKMRNDTVTASFYLNADSVQWGSVTNSDLLFYTNNINAMGISRLGGVGIGHSAGYGYNNSTIPQDNLLVQGNVGIGTTNPNTKLDVRGGINAGTNGTEFTLSSSGAVVAITYNGLTLTSQATGYTISGGTSGKTLTLDDNLTATTINSHLANTSNPHSVTQSQVGLGSVENTALSTWAGTGNITTVGTITTGTWNGTTISPTKGGTGIANGTNNTITFTGNYTLGLTLSANTSLTLPTSGTLATTSDKLSAFASTSSSELAGTISDETGSGSLVFATSPTFTTQLTTPKVVGDTTGLYLNEDGGAGIFVKDGGNVGIGTTNPGANKLQVTGGDIKFSSQAIEFTTDFSQSSGQGGYIGWQSGSGNGFTKFVNNKGEGGDQAFRFQSTANGTDFTDIMQMTETGSVGIGTTTPTFPLEIQKDSAGAQFQLALRDSTAKTWSSTVRDGIVFYSHFTGQLSNWAAANINYGYTDTTANGGATLAFDVVNTSGGWGNVMTLKGSGNVGIGTTNPAAKLHILESRSDNHSSGVYSGPGDLLVANSNITGANQGAFLVFSSRWSDNGGNPSSQGYHAAIKGANDVWANSGAGNLQFYTAASGAGSQMYERMRIDSAGKVGINTSSPAAELDVNGKVTINSGGTTSQLNVGASNELFYGKYTGTFGRSYLASNGSTDNFIMTSFSNYGDATYNYKTFFSQKSNNTDYAYFMTFSAGNVGINIYSPAYTLDVGGGTAGKNIRGYDIYSHDGGMNSFSDARLKDVQGNYSRGLAEIMQLNPIYYKYKQGNELGLDSDSQSISLLAQDVQRVIPEAVEVGQKGYLALNTNPLFYALINAVKEQQGQIESLKLALNSQGLLNASSSAEALVVAPSFIKMVQGALQSVGMVLQDGVASLKEVVADRFTAKEIQIIDKATGEKYCTWIENGEWVKTKGACDLPAVVPVKTSQPEPVPSSEPAQTQTAPETSVLAPAVSQPENIPALLDGMAKEYRESSSTVPVSTDADGQPTFQENIPESSLSVSVELPLSADVSTP